MSAVVEGLAVVGIAFLLTPLMVISFVLQKAIGGPPLAEQPTQ